MSLSEKQPERDPSRELERNLTIREAAPEQSEMLAGMMKEAAEVMVQAGVEQWKPEMFTAETVLSYFESRRVFMLSSDERPAGLFTLQAGDPAYWQELNDDSYLYLHRLTVRPLYRGLDYGGIMLRYAEEEAVRQGKQGLRLDCVAHLPKLNAYYLRNGFRFVAERDMKREVGGRYVNLYEKLSSV
ncbi:GNAT family N-acetyltransferase [Saccharibacillus alkalitolerans]|uniref:GNAT family N-acetyltransferase n=1 Tax=Saccharibacillus alkalitolerans TaxID=2705290 RepID=A0ABX0F0U7_9BACL|nr:GNAT family N-acetyltransferase [Saccharibacillus alkalitolerans]NGZ74521.1 GNAT family N-acetyltransferase [Saccharibacillus alkalitolerans]